MTPHRPEPDSRCGLTLDAGALIAAERGGSRIRRLATRAHDDGRPLTVSAAVVAQVWRDPRGGLLSAFLAACVVEPVDLVQARRAGELQARCGTDDTIDALVAVGAAARGDVVVTSDPGDLLVLADDLGGLRILAI